MSDQFNEGGLRAPPGMSSWQKVWWWFDFLVLVNLARLRFILILAAIGAVILYWDTLAAYYEKWTRPVFGEAQTASSGVKYYCTMHPQFVSDNPKDKCPICGMGLAKLEQKPAQGEPWPAGVVNRLQLSPYQVVTGNIQTWPVNYEPLSKRIQTVGFVEFDERKLRRIPARVKGRIDKLFVNVTGQMVHEGDPLASIYSQELAVAVQNLRDAPARDKELVRQRLRLWGIDDDQIKQMEQSRESPSHVTIRSPISGHVRKKFPFEGDAVDEGAPLFELADLSTVWIEAQVFEDDISFLKQGLKAEATTATLPNQRFTGRLDFLYPHLDAYTRTLRVRFDIENPEHLKKPEASLRPGDWATVTIDVPAAELAGRFLTRQGKVLAVPESAVIYTGTQKLVYRQHALYVFDAVTVELGPALTGPKKSIFYPVLKGLEAGDRVVSNGAILLDAETKVSGSAGSIYYQGTGIGRAGGPSASAIRPSTPEDIELKVNAGMAELSTPDRKLAEAQKYCPVLNSKLGSMGRPFKVVLKGQPVFLCCKDCESKARADEEGTLKKVEELKKKTFVSDLEAEIKAALDELSPEDRKLAEAQGYCAVELENRLGEMGKPYQLTIKGQRVFLCCKGCAEDALANPDRTLAAVEKHKAKVKSQKEVAP